MATKLFWTFLGPRLFRVYTKGGRPGHDYNPGFWEHFPDKIIQTMHTAYGMSYWGSPILATVLYRKGYFSNEGFFSLLKFFFSIVTVYSVAHFFRGLGRLGNSEYRSFIDDLVNTWNNPTPQTKRDLAGYDFEFWAWPVNFRWNEGSIDNKKKYIASSSSRRARAADKTGVICKVLGYAAIHSFGKSMIYPGATAILNYIVSANLRQGRARLVEEKDAQRSKLVTEDGNHIDSMFMDRRGRGGNGATLVITCEGNGGYYEMGCSETPISKMYSVLSWNHPGFGGSTGTPYPSQEQRAIDVVIQYAIHRLGFHPDNIALFAWSIGGYTATWAGKTYPDIKFMVLDATFDDLVPLAKTKMPQSWSTLVASSIRNYFDLNIAENLLEYHGPLLMIRRTRDEMISTEMSVNQVPVIASNRGNDLLLKMLQSRYPTIVDNETIPNMRAFLKLDTLAQASMLEREGVVYNECNVMFRSHVEANGVIFPMRLDTEGNSTLKKRLALFLITVHMENLVSSHCTELPGHLFHMPWSPSNSTTIG